MLWTGTSPTPPPSSPASVPPSSAGRTSPSPPDTVWADTSHTGPGSMHGTWTGLLPIGGRGEVRMKWIGEMNGRGK